MKKILFLIMGLAPTALFANTDCLSRKTAPNTPMTLEAVVQMGLCRNPTTSAAYLAAESARLTKNAGYAAYLPNVSASASLSKSYRNENLDEDWSRGASVSASYLIFDFGKRLSDLNALSASWRATGFDYDESVQNYVFGIIGSYYALLNADADVKTAQSLYTVATTARDTANKKFKAGVVARADVLKADSVLANRELGMVRAENNRMIARAALLTKLSFAPDSEIKILDMPSEFGRASENKSLDTLIALAEKSRPDLLRATANRDAAWHRRNSNFLKNMPSITATGTLSWNDNPADNLTTNGEKTTGTIGIRASMPIFAGFANVYGARAASVNYERSVEMEKYADQMANLDIFSAYQNYKTAQTVLVGAETLLKSATEVEKMTAGMYRAGRATMLEWQQAGADLADAQKQNNAAKYDLFTKRAAVALAIGDLKSEIEGDK